MPYFSSELISDYFALEFLYENRRTGEPCRIYKANVATCYYTTLATLALQLKELIASSNES